MYNSKKPKLDEISCKGLELEDINLGEHPFKDYMYMCIESNNLQTLK